MTMPLDSNAVGTVVAALLMAIGAAPARAQTQGDACWLRGDASEVAGRASKHDSTAVTLDGGTVKVCYGRPQRRGRTIMGQLVPYGQPWRMGADEATAIHVPFPARIAGVEVAPGSYSLYTIPEASRWRIVVNRDAQRWGVPINQLIRGKDVGSGIVRAEQLDKPVDALMITLRPTSKSAATMDVEWENTRVRVPVERR
jgi:Protein of unknown function (DUF2911)